MVFTAPRPAVDPWAFAADRLDPPRHRFADDVPGWNREVLHGHMTADQVRIAESVRQHRYTAVPSSHDTGKSRTAAVIAAHWIETHPIGEAFVVTTAPTWPQVLAILWREIGRVHRGGDLAGYITGNAEWKVRLGGPAELVGYGRKPADYDPSAFQGIHARYVLVVIDEACGVPRSIFDAADSLATNENARVLAVGNPDDPASHFRTICKPGSGWNVVQIDALRSPNFTADQIVRYPDLAKLMAAEGIDPSEEDIPSSLRELLISPTWVAERIRRWGVTSPLFTSKVRGRFPTVALDTIIDPHWVTLAQARELTPADTDPRMGVDVGRYGSDHSIIVLRRGGHCRVVIDVARGPVTELAGLVQEVGRGRINTPIANVDDTGVGGGVTDILYEEGYPVLPMLAGESPTIRDPDRDLLPNGRARFVDARSEWWWGAREALAGTSGTGADGWIDLDPEDDELAAQLTNVKYFVNRHGQIRVESKDEMRKRGVDSPDRADAFIMALVNDPPRLRGSDALPGEMITGGVLRSDAW